MAAVPDPLKSLLGPGTWTSPHDDGSEPVRQVPVLRSERREGHSGSFRESQCCPGKLVFKVSTLLTGGAVRASLIGYVYVGLG